MDPTDFVNSSETRLAVSRIITWTTEPKSSDVRKVRQDDEVFAVISFFKKNPTPPLNNQTQQITVIKVMKKKISG